jgi:signal transduction histidine kinase
MGGNDELTNLATNVNAMLESLQAQEKIKLARDNALEAARLKAEILANVSHDARTPLTVIQLRTDMMINGMYGGVNERQLEILRTIMISAQQLLSFANNLLEGAQLETGSLQLHIAPLEPKHLLDTIKTTLSPLATKKNLHLVTELGVDMPETVDGDEKRLERIMTNLISNAIKFTSSGSVTARIYRADDDHWAIDVEDTGPGISPEHQKQIFNPFWQVDGSTTRAANSGVGLGLTIVQQLTILMGGTISVNSTVGTGSVFTIVLPFEVPVKGNENGKETVRLRH